jgi:transposase
MQGFLDEITRVYRAVGRHLTGEQEEKIQKMIVDRHPEQLKLNFALWTREAVRLLIRQAFGLSMPIRTVGEYLKRWGFTPQKPVRRSYARCEAAVRRWLDEEIPFDRGKCPPGRGGNPLG